MPTWTPPTVEDTPPILPETRGVQYRLFRYYKTRTRGRNVYILTNGTVTESHPADVTVTTFGPPSPPGFTTVVPVSVRLTLFGGHGPQTITAADAAILQGAGYGANVSEGTWGTYVGLTWASLATEQWGGL